MTYRLELLPHPRFTHVSDAITAMTGYTPADHYADPELAGKLIHPEDGATLAAPASVGARRRVMRVDQASITPRP